MNAGSSISPITLPQTLSDLVDPATTALVLWDMQKGLAGVASNVEAMSRNAARLIAAADKAGVLVIWSRHSYHPLSMMSGPWQRYLLRKNKLQQAEQLEPVLAAARGKVAFLNGFEPKPNHIVIDKHQPSLFLDTPLEHYLRIRNIRSLVLTGFATDIGIEFTARHAHARGYFSIVVEDATGAYDPAEHERSILFLRKFVDVSTTEDIATLWNSSPQSRGNAK